MQSSALNTFRTVLVILFFFGNLCSQTYDADGNPIERSIFCKYSKTADYDSTFEISDTLLFNEGVIPGSGQLSKNGLEYYLSIKDVNKADEKLYVMSRPTLMDIFGLAELLDGTINDTLTANIQPSITEDRLTIVFVRSKQGLWNFNDLYMASRPDISSPFDSARALDEINIENQADAYPYITPDGLRLYFTRGAATRQFLMSSRVSLVDTFTTPVPLQITIPNATARSTWLSNDELEMYFTDADTSSYLYYASRTSINDAFSTPVRFPSISDYGHVQGPSLIENQLFLNASPNEKTNITLIFLGKPVISQIDTHHDLKQSPKSFSLNQNYPNPFNPMTTITYTLVREGYVVLDVYDIVGKKVRSLVNKKQYANSYNIRFLANNLNSGIYFYTLKVNNHIIDTKKMVLLK